MSAPWDIAGDEVKLSANYVVLDGSAPLFPKLTEILEASAQGWIYLVVSWGTGFYRALAIDDALIEALYQWAPMDPAYLRAWDLPLPEPLPPLDEDTSSSFAARVSVHNAPAHCLPVVRGGEVIGVLAGRAPRLPDLDDWRQAFAGAPPWGAFHEEIDTGVIIPGPVDWDEDVTSGDDGEWEEEDEGEWEEEIDWEEDDTGIEEEIDGGLTHGQVVGPRPQPPKPPPWKPPKPPPWKQPKPPKGPQADPNSPLKPKPERHWWEPPPWAPQRPPPFEPRPKPGPGWKGALDDLPPVHKPERHWWEPPMPPWAPGRPDNIQKRQEGPRETPPARQGGKGKKASKKHKRAKPGREPMAGGGPPVPKPPPPAPRFFNAGFLPAHEDVPLPPDQPLALDGGPYRLGVNVGAFWGPGEKPEERFALDDILRDDLDRLMKDQWLTLIVAVRPRAVKKNLVQVDPPRQELTLPKWKDGPYAFFGLTFTRPGRHALNVDLFYQGHLLQSLRVEFWVVQHAGDAVPAGRKPQDRRLTFSRTGALSKDRLAALEKRPSTLTILVDRQGGQINLWFYDVEGRALGTQQPNLSDAILQGLLGRMREALQQVQNGYPGQIGGDREKLRLSLWRLASAGHEFYRALLPRVFDPEAPGPAGQLVELNLIPGQVIQVAPLSMLPGVPWELLYDRAIEPFDEAHPDRVALCPDFETHPPEACPHDSSKVVCPLSFWGYRTIIEQLPNWVAPGEPPPLADLPLLVRNGRPLKFVPLVYGWKNLKTHLEALRALAKEQDLDLEPEVTTLDRLEQELKDQDDPADILYFYAHGGFDEHGPMLELGPEGAKFKFTAGDLAAWKDEIDLSLRQPLVVFNACETAAFLPEHHESLPKGFADRGAAGVIGTQVKVHETFAAHFIRLFFQKFLAKQTVGQSLFEARRELLFHYVDGEGGREFRPDPRGLVYSLFAAADVELAEPVIPPGGAGGDEP
jgi:hypothetical protein